MKKTIFQSTQLNEFQNWFHIDRKLKIHTVMDKSCFTSLLVKLLVHDCMYHQWERLGKFYGFHEDYITSVRGNGKILELSWQHRLIK